MRKKVLVSLLISTWMAHAVPTTELSDDPKIRAFLKAETLSKTFPYRINIFTDGQIDKNKAGLRISETSKQLRSNDSGLLFYYELLSNAMRVPHWHANATEVGTVLNGKMRVTIWDGAGETKVFTVEKHGTWIIPQAKLHALENIGTEEMRFLVAYDSPIAADRDFLTAWASLPDAILARAVGLTEADIRSIKKTTVNRLSSFDPAAGPEKMDIASPLSNSFLNTSPLYQSDLGSITRIDTQLNSNMKAMALQRTILKPKALRLPHWYTSGDVLLFVLNGQAFFTMMNDNGEVYHTRLKRGDLVSVPVGNFHSFLNIGKNDLEVYEVFNQATDIQEITLANGVQHFNVGTIQGATQLPRAIIQKIAQSEPQSYIIPF